MKDQAERLVRFLVTPGMIRNYVRYLLMFMLASGWVSQELSDNINSCDLACAEIFRHAEIVLSGLGIAAVERIYAIARARGWAT